MSNSIGQKRHLIDTKIKSKKPPKKRSRKEINSFHNKLLTSFANRCHQKNNINLGSYHSKKQNIKTLCPKHDMLPVILDMERTEMQHNGSSSNQKKCSWMCTGSIYKSQCKQVLGLCRTLREYEFDVQQVAKPFMDAIVAGAQIPNITIAFDKSNMNSVATSNSFQIKFKPLHNSSLLNEPAGELCNITVKSVSGGTFKRNLQPVPDACRITKIANGEGCYIPIMSETLNSLMYLKVWSVLDATGARREYQAVDSVLGVGFDCASNVNWQKPKVYWMHELTIAACDSNSNRTHKKKVSNRDLRFSLLYPPNSPLLQGYYNLTIYMPGVTDHTTNIILNNGNLNLASINPAPLMLNMNTNTTRPLGVPSDSNSFGDTNNINVDTQIKTYDVIGIELDLEHARIYYLNHLKNISFKVELYQQYLTKWLKICLELCMNENDCYSQYFKCMIQRLIDELGVDKMIQGLCKPWMVLRNDSWTFLHMIAERNLFHLFSFVTSKITNPLQLQHLLLLFAICKSSRCLLTPLYLLIVNGHSSFLYYVLELIRTQFAVKQPYVIQSILENITPIYEQNHKTFVIRAMLQNVELHSCLKLLVRMNNSNQILSHPMMALLKDFVYDAHLPGAGDTKLFKYQGAGRKSKEETDANSNHTVVVPTMEAINPSVSAPIDELHLKSLFSDVISNTTLNSANSSNSFHSTNSSNSTNSNTLCHASESGASNINSSNPPSNSNSNSNSNSRSIIDTVDTFTFNDTRSIDLTNTNANSYSNSSQVNLFSLCDVDIPFPTDFLNFDLAPNAVYI